MVRAGYLDDVLAVFDQHQHPFILLEESALRWMGVAEMGWECTDVLVRTSQVMDILNALIASKRWEMAERPQGGPVLASMMGLPLLKRVCHEEGEAWFLSLWSETDYHLSVDGVPIIEVPDARAYNTVLAQEEFHPDRERRRYGPFLLGTEKAMPFVSPRPARTAKQKTPIFIPTIPAFLDALLDQARSLQKCSAELSYSWRPLIHVDHMVRYLYLEEEYQRKALLPQLALRNHAQIVQRLRRYKRKKTVTLVDGKLKQIVKGRALFENSQTEGDATCLGINR